MSRVLILTDDLALGGDLQGLLRRDGHGVRSAALLDFDPDSAQAFAPDVILLDLAAGGLSASVRLSLLRNPLLRRAPLVAVAESADEARNLGADGFLPRPVQLEDLQSVLAPLLQPPMDYAV